MTNEPCNVSRETIKRLRIFESVIKRWAPAINLVSRNDRDYIWERHIADSLEMVGVAPASFQHWLDLGSGGGFPGVVVAIIALENKTAGRVTLVESDKRKAVFLREALRETGSHAEVVNERIESIAHQDADVVSARALASLTSLIDLSTPHMTTPAVGVFAKGKKWREELREAQQKWSFKYTHHQSKLNPEAAILKIEGISRV